MRWPSCCWPSMCSRKKTSPSGCAFIPPDANAGREAKSPLESADKRGEVPSFVEAAEESERFSQDQEWMPTTVLIAKSTYVWLEQLSRQYGRHIHRLDQIPDEELAPPGSARD